MSEHEKQGGFVGFEPIGSNTHLPRGASHCPPGVTRQQA
jgi:hypothetical protein